MMIKIDNASYSWQFENDQKLALENISFQLKRGQLLAVIGSVGCGKTTLLHSVMEETTRTCGTQKVTGTVSYVEQEPFIFSDTI